ncbi:hydroxyproline-rich glycoprotein family protein [Trifolium pratense]|uniref:Hydroxyproline-rich glycoprotein family protein n=1 Tax=Trifolium pratense TaxID=57577 RepID=A0A2K3MRR7_TRIPR|nr:hydroxyproline-rich glycoprotein family protein [Trifolium pratense]
MELQDTAASKITIGLPLGLALLFACLIFICVLFCCLLHWNKLKLLSPYSSEVISSQAQTQADLTSSPQKPAFPFVMMKQSYAESLPVLMPGDEIPKFIAMACPWQVRHVLDHIPLKRAIQFIK